MNTTRVLRKQTYNMVTRSRPRSTAKTSLMSKVPSKINNFEGLEKVCHKFSQTFLWKRHDTPHQTSTDNDPQNIVTHRIWQSTIRHTYRHSPYLTKPHKVKSPPSTSHLFKTFSNIYLFPDLTIFVLTTLFRRRFDRTFREIRLTSRPEIRSDSGSDGPLTALTTPMI